MRSFSQWIIALFATPAGVVVLAALDSTIFFSLPFGIDAVVVILAAQLRELWWVVPLLATIGATAGAGLTFWIGVQIGERGVERWVPQKRLARIRVRVRERGAIALAILDLIPPPFPFTAFVLAAGALEVDTVVFFVTLTGCRLFRFGVEGLLARIYGRSIVGWLDSDLFHDIVAFFSFLAIALTTFSVVRIVRTTRSAKRRAAA